MSLKADTQTVNEVQSPNYDKRFVCQADQNGYSVELVIQVFDDEKKGVLTVWDDLDLIVNREEVDVGFEGLSEEDAANFFDQFLMGRVNKHLEDKMYKFE